MVKRALVLSGGGSKGAYQVGALKALCESGRTWNLVYGISVGALNGAWIAMHKPEEQKESISGLLKIWNEIESSEDIYTPWWIPAFLRYIPSLWKGSLNSGMPLRKIVTKFWNREKFLQSGVKFSIGCVSLTTTKYHTIEGTNENIFEYILASSHLPIIFEPLLIDNELWVDGGLRHQIPFLEALKENPDEIDVISTQPITNYEAHTLDNKKLKSAIKVGLRSANIFSDQVYFNDCMNVVHAINDYGKKHNIKINFYTPSVLPNTDSMNFDKKTIKNVIEMGYLETKTKLEKTNNVSASTSIYV